MTAGSAQLPPGQQLTPGRRWWRRLTYVPLVVLAVLSVGALVAGTVTKADNERRANEPAAVTSSANGSPIAQACRPVPPAYDRSPWWEDAAAREAVWAEHSDEIAQPYVVGPNGWIFWSDQIDQYVSQAVGRTHLTAPEAARWVDHFEAVRAALAAQGVEFYVIVTPSTSSVYPEELPTWMQDIRGATALDQLVAAAPADLPLVDLRSDLVGQKTTSTHLFSWDNSHWTDFGAYSSWDRITQCVNTAYPDGEGLRTPAISGSQIIGDFNEWASYGVQSPGADWSAPVYSEQLQDVTRTSADGTTEVVPGVTTTDAGTLPVTTTVAAPWTGKSALIFRDSMGGGLSPLWQQSYSPTWQIWHRYRAGFDDPESYTQYVEQYRPDVVVVQLAERHLINTPVEGSGL